MNRFSGTLEHVYASAGLITDALFGYPKNRLEIITSRWLMGVFYLTVLIAWGSILNWGDIPLDRADWYDITAPRLTLMQQAFRNDQIPVQGRSTSWARSVGDRFQSIGDILVSPQVVLLKTLSIGQFALFQVALMVSLGFWGLVRLKQRYRLSLIAFLPLVWLFFFNGHMVTHISIGHLSWTNIFLLPFSVDLVFELYRSTGPVASWKWGARFALAAGAILLQGGQHTFTLLLLMLAAIGVIQPRRWKPIAAAFFFSILLGAVRILPIAIMVQSLENPFSSGFTTVNELLQGLIDFRPIQQALGSLSPVTPQVAWWEFDFFIGWIGFSWMIFFGIAKPLHRQTFPGIRPLLGAAGLITLLSIGRIYNVFFILHIPMLNGERISSRLFILPLIILVTLASIEFQRWIEHSSLPRSAVRGLSVAGLIVLVSDLRQHFESWKITELPALFPQETAAHSVALISPPDPTYLAWLIVGAALSMIAGIGLLYLAFRPSGKGTNDPATGIN